MVNSEFGTPRPISYLSGLSSFYFFGSGNKHGRIVYTSETATYTTYSNDDVRM